MDLSVKKFKFIDQKELSKELEFVVACEKVAGNEILIIEPFKDTNAEKFRTGALRLLKSMKRDMVIKLFVSESELFNPEKMEGVYLLNKFPQLSELSDAPQERFYIKL